MRSDYMTIGEAADALGVTRTTVWRRIKSGELEVFRSQTDRRERLVRRADIEAMLRPAETDQGKGNPAHNLTA
ncbi:MAG TPA: helix-turn-helix domain-containing protein [Thermomicrobiales bacterium]|nr:helix-turn-helix domain-containing protein [Thermomicrobiales bacterium]